MYKDDSGNIDVGKLYKMVYEGLLSQGVKDMNELELFKLNPDGTPVHSPDNKVVKDKLLYYIFAAYSKITSEKVSGNKYIHQSDWGFQVLANVDNPNITIPTERYKKLDDEARSSYTPRNLQIAYDENEKTYTVEVILSKPYFESKREEAFWKRRISKMFATRIPTEDKRSMITFKVVDFIDSAHANNIIAPYFVHLVSGSDLDIDSLYTRSFNYYLGFDNNYHVYGDYSNYDARKGGILTSPKLLEIMSYLSNTSYFKDFLNIKTKELLNENTIGDKDYFFKDNLKPVDNSKDSYDEDSFEIIPFEDYYEEFEQEDYYKQENYFGIKNLFSSTQYRLLEEALADKEIKEDLLRSLETGEKLDKEDKKRGQKKALLKYYKILGIINFLEEEGYDIKYKLDEVSDNIVRPKHQNRNLDATIKILSHKEVFEHLLSAVVSNDDALKDIAKINGVDPNNSKLGFNHHSVPGKVKMMVTNASNKDGIGITARTNSMVGILNMFGLKTKSADKHTNQILSNNTRIIASNGNLLGVFTDGAKTGLPGSLQLDSISTSVILAIKSATNDELFAHSFAYVPLIRKAVANVLSSTGIFNTEGKLSLSKALGDEILKLGGSKDFKLNDYTLKYEPKLENANNFGAIEILSSKDLGYSVYDNLDRLVDPKLQELYMLMYFKKYVDDNSVSELIGSLTTLVKSINPDLDSFDKLVTTYKDNLDKLKIGRDDLVINKIDLLGGPYNPRYRWRTLINVYLDLNETLSKIFKFRGQEMTNIVSSLEPFLDWNSEKNKNYYKERLISSIAIKNYIDYRSDEDEVGKASVASVYKNFTYSKNRGDKGRKKLTEELLNLKKLYPDNIFIKYLKISSSDLTSDKDKYYYYTLNTRPSEKEKIQDSIKKLFEDEYEFMDSLYLQELFRSNLGKVKDSLIDKRFFPASIFLNLTKKGFDRINFSEERTMGDLTTMFTIALNELASDKNNIPRLSTKIVANVNKVIKNSAEKAPTLKPFLENYKMGLRQLEKGNKDFLFFEHVSNINTLNRDDISITLNNLLRAIFGSGYVANVSVNKFGEHTYKLPRYFIQHGQLYIKHGPISNIPEFLKKDAISHFYDIVPNLVQGESEVITLLGDTQPIVYVRLAVPLSLNKSKFVKIISPYSLYSDYILDMKNLIPAFGTIEKYLNSSKPEDIEIVNQSIEDYEHLPESKETEEDFEFTPYEDVTTPSQIQGINIYTKSTDKLGRELTNPNWGAKHIMDIEAEYKANASKKKASNLSKEERLKYDIDLMYKLQMKKFKAHPELVQAITDRGGIPFLEASEHTVGVKGSRWEGKGTNSEFIKVLIKSYQDSLNTTQVESQPKPEITVKIIPLNKSQRFTRESVEKDTEYMYLFTDNAKRTSGRNSIKKDGMYAVVYNKDAKYPTMTQAVIRGLDNAYPITTMVDDNRTQWTDAKFEEYKNIIDLEIDHIKGDLESGAFKGIKFSAQKPFGVKVTDKDISDMKKTAPKIWNYLNIKLFEIGIDNTGDIPVSIQFSTNVNTEVSNQSTDNNIDTNKVEVNESDIKDRQILPEPTIISDKDYKIAEYLTYNGKTYYRLQKASKEGVDINEGNTEKVKYSVSEEPFNNLKGTLKGVGIPQRLIKTLGITQLSLKEFAVLEPYLNNKDSEKIKNFVTWYVESKEKGDVQFYEQPLEDIIEVYEICISNKGAKAEDGLVTSFTKGGKWKLIKDLKGYPTHEKGGVDLTIGKDGVRIKNGNTEFKAEHGLVITEK